MDAVGPTVLELVTQYGFACSTLEGFNLLDHPNPALAGRARQTATDVLAQIDIRLGAAATLLERVDRYVRDNTPAAPNSGEQHLAKLAEFAQELAALRLALAPTWRHRGQVADKLFGHRRQTPDG